MSFQSDACLSCDSRDRELVLDLGETPLANAYVRPEKLSEPELAVPLRVLFCKACGLVQLSHVVPPEILFSSYAYMTGASTTMVEHFRALAAHLTRRFGLDEEDLVVEVASNDGTLLRGFADLGLRTLGVEPAENLIDVARQKGIESVNLFFDEECARELREERGPAAVVCANNVLAHVADLPGVLAGCRTLVEPAGVVSIEVPYLARLLEHFEYDTIYHEHLSYFSVRAAAEAFRRQGLAIIDIEELPVHGGSLRLLARAGAEHAPVVGEMIERERELGMEDVETYHRFARRVAENKAALLELLHGLTANGSRLAAYGAPAKGNTLLNYCGIGTELLEFTVDRNQLKVGTYTPGMRIPIREVDALFQDRPDYTLILPWNIAEEIRSQERAYVQAGGRFMVPIPEPKVLS